MKEFFNLDKIIKVVKDITAGKTIEPQSDKAKKIGLMLSNLGNNSAYTNKLAKIFSKVIGEPIRVKKTCGTSAFPMGTMIVLTENRNSHNYNLNEPILIDHISGKVGLRMSGLIGNTFNPDYARKATNEEIDTYFKCFNYLCGFNYLGQFIKNIF